MALLTACTGGPAPVTPTAPPFTSGPPSSAAGRPGPGLPSTAPTRSPLCNGRAGKTLITGLFADLSAGRHPDMSHYFGPPVTFAEWFDPTTTEVITFLPGPGSGTVTLDALRDHLDSLARGGFSATVTHFVDHGYTAADADRPGGLFTFDIRGRASRSSPSSAGAGSGLVDCATGKLKMVLITSW
jgi:hypothetical protein